MICKIYEAYIEFIQCRSDAVVEMSEYTLKSKLPQVKYLNRTLRCVTFHSSFNCSLPECLLFIIFLTRVSAFAYLIVIYNSIFQISFQVLQHIAFRRMPASMLGFLVFLCQYVDSFPLNYMLKFENTPPIFKIFFISYVNGSTQFLLHLSSYDMQS